MFGSIGTNEIVVIMLIALLLFGPKKLPEIGRTVGIRNAGTEEGGQGFHVVDGTDRH